MVGSHVKSLGTCDVDISSVERPIVVGASFVTMSVDGVIVVTIAVDGVIVVTIAVEGLGARVDSISVVATSVIGLDVVIELDGGDIVTDIVSLDISQ